MDLPELYSTSSPFQKRDVAIILSEYLDRFNWSEDDHILDFGCGDGDVTFHLANCIPRCSSLIGVDISKAMVDYARHHHQHGDGILRFQEFDIMNTIDPTEHFPHGFNKIFSFYCFHWIKDHKHLMHQMFQMLRPEGEMLLVFLASNPIFSMYERMAEKTEWAEYMKDVEEFVPNYQYLARPADAFADVCNSAGFEVIECVASERTYAFQNVNTAKNAIAAVNPFLHRIPVTLRERYLYDCLLEIQKLKVPSADGSTVASYRLMIAHIRRPYLELNSNNK